MENSRFLLSGASDLLLPSAFDIVGRRDVDRKARTLIDGRCWSIAMLTSAGLQAISAKPLIEASWAPF